MIRTSKNGANWQVILADLSLILFITVLAGLVTARNTAEPKQREISTEPAQAIYRKTAGGLSLGEWLDMEAGDTRALLTIHASYAPGGKAEAIRNGKRMWEDALNAGYEPRLIVEPSGEQAVFAVLAYDKPQMAK